MFPLVLVTALLAIQAGETSIPACLAGHKPVARWALPPLLREVSGLALAPDGRLFMHNDEVGLIGAFDSRTGEVAGSWQLGTMPPRGDFEGIAIGDGQVFLTTSDGVLYRAPLPPADSRAGALGATRIATGFGRACEIEGLAWDPGRRDLLFACKEPRDKDLGRDITVFRWSPARDEQVGDPIRFERSDLGRGKGARNFHPSAIEVDPRSGLWVMLASADGAVASVEPGGRVRESLELPRRHRQPEGLAIGADGRVYVSDEGGQGPGIVTIYDCR